MKTFSSLRYPPGGYSFHDADGTEFTGDSVGRVAAKLAEYREVNHFPPGRPVEEVHTQLCERFPECCVEDTVAIDGQALVRRVVTRAKEWITKLQLRQKFSIVDPAVVPTRAESCQNCPHNVNWRLICMPCQLNTALLLDPVVFPYKPYARMSGRCCDVAGDDLSVAVWLDDTKIDTDCDCWRKASPTVDVSTLPAAHNQ